MNSVLETVPGTGVRTQQILGTIIITVFIFLALEKLNNTVSSSRKDAFLGLKWEQGGAGGRSQEVGCQRPGLLGCPSPSPPRPFCRRLSSGAGGSRAPRAGRPGRGARGAARVRPRRPPARAGGSAQGADRAGRWRRAAGARPGRLWALRGRRPRGGLCGSAGAGQPARIGAGSFSPPPAAAFPEPLLLSSPPRDQGHGRLKLRNGPQRLCLPASAAPPVDSQNRVQPLSFPPARPPGLRSPPSLPDCCGSIPSPPCPVTPCHCHCDCELPFVRKREEKEEYGLYGLVFV